VCRCVSGTFKSSVLAKAELQEILNIASNFKIFRVVNEKEIPFECFFDFFDGR